MGEPQPGLGRIPRMSLGKSPDPAAAAAVGLGWRWAVRWLGVWGWGSGRPAVGRPLRKPAVCTAMICRRRRRRGSEDGRTRTQRDWREHENRRAVIAGRAATWETARGREEGARREREEGGGRGKIERDRDRDRDRDREGGWGGGR